MIDIFLGGVLPIFAIGAIGYVLGRRGTFDAAMAAAVNRFVFLVAVPCLGFRLLVNAPIETFDPRLLVGFLASELSMYALGFGVARWLFKTELKESVLLGLACSFTNHILFVLPIAVALFGEAAAAPIVAIIAVDSVVLFGLTLIAMEFLTAPNASLLHVGGQILRNPPVMSLVLGLVVALIGIDMPRSVDTFLGFAGGAAAPCALFSLGVVLSQPVEAGRNALPAAITAMKLLLHPALAWLLLVTLFALPQPISTPAMMVAAAPCGAMGFVLVLNYGVRVDAIARAILYSSVGSLLTITLAATL